MASPQATANRRANRRAAKISRLRGVTVVVIGGGGHTIGDQVGGKVEESREAIRRREAHQSRWERFQKRWGANDRFAWLIADMRHWEAWQAMIPIRGNPHIESWWFGVSAPSRLDLCEIGRQWRASARNYRRLTGRGG